MSAVFSDVPASLFFTPAAANASRTTTVSLKLRPALLATAPDWESAIPKSDTSAVVLFAAVANASATFIESLPLSANRFIEFAVIAAASPSSMLPAAARERAELRPPCRMSLTARPPFASSSCAFPASAAENAVARPASIACFLSCSNSFADAFVTALTALICFSYAVPVLMTCA